MPAIERRGVRPVPAQSPKEGQRAGQRLDASSNPDPRDSQLVGRTGAPASGRALVPTTPSRPSAICVTRPQQSAVFLAHLIATAQQAPQTRARRRAEPDEARAVYLAAGAADIGRTIRRLV